MFINSNQPEHLIIDPLVQIQVRGVGWWRNGSVDPLEREIADLGKALYDLVCVETPDSPEMVTLKTHLQFIADSTFQLNSCTSKRAIPCNSLIPRFFPHGLKHGPCGVSP